MPKLIGSNKNNSTGEKKTNFNFKKRKEIEKINLNPIVMCSQYDFQKLITKGYNVKYAKNMDEIKEKIDENKINLLLISHMLVEKSKKEFMKIKEIKEMFPRVSINLISEERAIRYNNLGLFKRIGLNEKEIKKVLRAIDNIFYYEEDYLFEAIFKYVKGLKEVKEDKKRVILAVDDDPYFLSYYLMTLTRKYPKAHILIADNVEKAKEIITKYGERLSGIITDYSLPDTKRKENENGKALEIIIHFKERTAKKIPLFVATYERNIGEFLPKDVKYLYKGLDDFKGRFGVFEKYLDYFMAGEKFYIRDNEGLIYREAETPRDLAQILQTLYLDYFIKYIGSVPNWLYFKNQEKLAKKIENLLMKKQGYAGFAADEQERLRTEIINLFKKHKLLD